MYKFMRAVGFSMYQKKQDMAKLLKRLVREAEVTGHLTGQEGNRLYELRTEVAPGIGVAVIGEISPKGAFSREYYFPCVKDLDVGSEAEHSIQRHAEHETYTGPLDEYRVGMSLIFYMENSMGYRMRSSVRQPVRPKGAALMGLAVQGKVLLPANKTEKQAEDSRQAAKKRSSLLEAAKHGDEDTIETLIIEDIGLYSMVSRRVAYEDTYSIIETCFVPCSIECNQYSVIGEVMEISTSTNRITKEEIYNLRLDYNDMIFHIAINKQGLLGEPRIGRCFKGQVWMQDTVVFQELCRMVVAVVAVRVVI